MKFLPINAGFKTFVLIYSPSFSIFKIYRVCGLRAAKQKQQADEQANKSSMLFLYGLLLLRFNSFQQIEPKLVFVSMLMNVKEEKIQNKSKLK